MDFAIVDEYRQMIVDGTVFDPCEGLIDADGKLYVFDGYHRGEAHKAANTPIRVRVRPGTRQDAEWLALGANIKHGIRRTNEDVQRVVKNALAHPNATNLSDREIARHCGTDHKTVGKYRKQLADANSPQIAQDSGEIPTPTQIEIAGWATQQNVPKCEQCGVALPEGKPLVKLMSDDARLLCDACHFAPMLAAQPELAAAAQATVTPNEPILHFYAIFDQPDGGNIDIDVKVSDLSPTLPLLDDVARGRGWCNKCRYAYSGHYINGHGEGKMWCILSILKNKRLAELLQVERVKTYANETTPTLVIDDDDDDTDFSAQGRETFDEDTDLQAVIDAIEPLPYQMACVSCFTMRDADELSTQGYCPSCVDTLMVRMVTRQPILETVWRVLEKRLTDRLEKEIKRAIFEELNGNGKEVIGI
jgi:hypothetical protein